jgi:tryptophanyl-tRNA synthetase
MKIDMGKDWNDVAYRTLMMVICAQGRSEVLIRFINSMEKRAKPEDGFVFDINFTVNGEEFDFTEVAKEYSRQMSDLVKREAFELIQNQLSDSMRKIESVRELSERFEAEVRIKLGIRED